MLRRLSIAVLAAAAFTLGCADNGPAMPQIRVTPQGSQFQLVPAGTGSSATIPFTVTNIGKQTVFLAGCGVALADRFENGQWVPVDGPNYICALANSVITELAPGGSVNEARTVDQAGTYRLRVTFSADIGGLTARGVAASPSVVVQ